LGSDAELKPADLLALSALGGRADQTKHLSIEQATLMSVGLGEQWMMLALFDDPPAIGKQSLSPSR
jgi:hypothetical protein